MLEETRRKWLAVDGRSDDDNGNHEHRRGGGEGGEGIGVVAVDAVLDVHSYGVYRAGSHSHHDYGDHGDGDRGRQGQEPSGYHHHGLTTRGKGVTDFMEPSTTSSSGCSRLWRILAVGSDLLQNRWAVLTAVFWIQAIAGVQYAFPLISPVMKRSLKYDQEEIDFMAAAKDFSCSFKFVGSLLLNFLNTPMVLVIGAFANTFGYLTVWLAVMQKIKLEFWMVTFAVVVGYQAAAVADVVGMVACVNHFPFYRGQAIGLSKCILGLSAAMCSQIYRSFFEPDVDFFLLTLAVVPAVIMLSVSPLFRTFKKPQVVDIETTRIRFQFLNGMIFFLAIYLLAITVIEENVQSSKNMKRVSTCVMLIIFCLPLLTPLLPGKRSLVDVSQAESSSKQKEDSREGTDEEKEISAGAVVLNSSLHAPFLPKVSAELENMKLPDMTPLESLGSFDFWLFVLAACIGIGSGVTIINNISQMVESLGGHSADTHVSLISSASGLGRLFSGLISEILLNKYEVPRSICLSVAVAGQTLSLIFAAFSSLDMLYFVSIMAGLSYGALWTMIPAITSEIIGITHFSVNYGLVISFPIGSYSMAYLTGTWYDSEAKAQQHGGISSILDYGTESVTVSASALTCRGASCFHSAFLACSAISFCGFACTLLLARRTRRVYHDIIAYQKRKIEEGAS